MKIIITDRRKIFAIQREFNEMFPFLKLEFHARASKTNVAASLKIVKESSKTLGECRTIHNMGVLTITPAMSVKDLEQHFRDVYGLSVQILRKSGKVWLGTTVTDNWTLKEQNEQGELLSNHETETAKRKEKNLKATPAKTKKYFIN
jgi:hypothetical protein